MYNIKTINKISPVGLDKLKAKGCNVGEDIAAPDGIIVRSADMHDYEVNPELLGVARAGAGYNNIPIDELAEKGIVVFNSPGRECRGGKGADRVLDGACLARCCRQHRVGKEHRRSGR